MSAEPKRELQGPRAVLRFIGRSGKRIGVTIVGFLLLLAGGIMMVTPGPGTVAIIAGLAILATEYTWAEIMLDKVKEKAKQAGDAVRKRSRRNKPDPEPPA
ncbi:MAG TPA: PGPGW domain-containing protein [Actinomycetota bacterium]